MAFKKLQMRRALLLGSAATLLAVSSSGVSVAQDQDDALVDDEVEQIFVTGSRIPRGDLVSTSPIAVLGEQDILFSGRVTLEDVLNELPQVAPSLGGTTNNGGTGAATVDLRALNAISGSQRTLVLVNGRRYLASDAEGRVDLNSIPSALINRIEVVTGGASAVYGSDAIAGAVNFILRDDFEGIRASSQYTISDEGDGETLNVNVTMGSNFADDRGNAALFVDYYDRKTLLASERPLTAVARDDIGAPAGFIELGSSRIPGGQIIQPNQVLPDGSMANAVGFMPDGTPVANPDSFNFQTTNFIQTPLQRFLIHGQANYEVNRHFTGFMELTYSNNQVDQQLAQDANDIPDGGDAPLFVPYMENPFIADNAVLSAFLGDNFDQGTNLDAVAGDGIATIPDFRRRMTENGPRFEDRVFNSFRAMVGGYGELPDFGFGQNWNYEFFYSFATTNRTSILNSFTSDLRIQQAVNATTDAEGNPVCMDPSGDCAPIGLFGEGSISEAAQAFIAPQAIESEDTEQQIFNVSFTGELAELDAGPLSVAFGYEFRDEEAKNEPDLFLQTGELGPGNDNDPTEGGFQSSEIFGEVLIPVLADKTFAKSLNIEGAIRVADYDTVGTTFTYKAGGDWTPFEGFRIRGLFQRAVRAPNVNELSQGNSADSPSFSDICSAAQINEGAAAGFGLSLAQLRDLCIQQGVPASQVGIFVADSQVLAITTGNPNLTEETARTATIGFVYTPEAIPGLSITADYYRIRVDDAIDDVNLQTVQSLCAQDFAASGTIAGSVFCDAIVRSPINGAISRIVQPRLNLGSEFREGIDWQIDYSFELANLLPFGGFAVDGATMRFFQAGNYTLSNETSPIEGETIDCNGIFGGGCTGLGDFAQPVWRLNNNLDYAVGKFSARVQLRILGKLTNAFIDDFDDLGTPETGVEGYLDIAFNYDVTENIQLFAGVNNALDNEAPLLGFGFTGRGGGADANTDPSLYDVIGRVFFFGGTLNF